MDISATRGSAGEERSRVMRRIADPFSEIRLTGVHTICGANYWSRFPVTRLVLDIGAFDDISSAEVPAASAALVRALPGLVEHHCSVGERGGFVTRLNRGTYAAHIIEHVALELQAMIGHGVGFGRARGGERPGEYVVIIEHRHSVVGRRAALFALELVQRAFAGSELPVAEMTAALTVAAEQPDEARVAARVACAITGSGPRALVRAALAARLRAPGRVLDIPPRQLLREGLPYRSSRLAVILGSALDDVPVYYREAGRAERLLSVIADGVSGDGVVILPAHEQAVRERLEAAGVAVAVFAQNGDRLRNHGAAATARIRRNRIEIVSAAGGTGYVPLVTRQSPAIQLVVELARSLLEQPVRGGGTDVQTA
jgi:hypothetical protein